MAQSGATSLLTHVVTGFLGAGKTTLLNRILRTPAAARTLVIVNEFGEIGLDHLLIAAAQDNILLLESGCLCCELIGSLRETLADLLHSRHTGSIPDFDRIVIETSGLADPAPILETLLDDRLLKGKIMLGSVICVVDAQHWRDTLDGHHEARAQLMMADRVVITKADLADAGAAVVKAGITALGAPGEVYDAAQLDDPLTLLRPPPLVIAHNARTSLGSHRHHEHNGDIDSWSTARAHAATWAGIAAWTGHLAQRWGKDLLRCKALIELAGEATPVLVQGVRGHFTTERLPAWPDAARGERIVLIGRGLSAREAERGLAWLDVPPGQQIPPTSGFPDDP